MSSLTPAKENVFSKIKRNLFRIFFATEKNDDKMSAINLDTKNISRENFKEKLATESDNEEHRILELKNKYDNNEIFEKDISHDDMKKLIKLYKKEKTDLDKEIESRKQNIARMLREMKQANATEN